MNRLSVVDLFAGLGGFSLGLERTHGFKTIGFCEIEPFQRAVLAKHWPDVRCYEDIRHLGLIEGGVDVITGGFPCQPFSTASRGRKVAENLWPAMLDVIECNAPSFVIAENVQEAPIRKAENDLRSIGYNVTVRNISADDAGAPHGRSRWWAIAHPYEESEFQRTLDAEVAKLPELCAGLWGAEAYAGALRVSNGVSHRVHRVEALGNAVLPQIPQVIGRAILNARAVGGWLPIETAPTEGGFLAANQKEVWAAWHFNSENWHGRYGSRGATHWRALPKPPSSLGDSEDTEAAA